MELKANTGSGAVWSGAGETGPVGLEAGDRWKYKPGSHERCLDSPAGAGRCALIAGTALCFSVKSQTKVETRFSKQNSSYNGDQKQLGLTICFA